MISSWWVLAALLVSWRWRLWPSTATRRGDGMITVTQIIGIIAMILLIAYGISGGGAE